ncbi:MAG: PorP/SprF family type IX secretion system membrane protein [Crocinitomicaceae bacterium]|nr:PorP/SprF family type IX secretion system membrane protein [Crocinitomicaceae bacterium]MBK8926347.1 PorP/SprF family type IX secretion system membrane protein [Crocinitomicaceae bacterium]
MKKIQAIFVITLGITSGAFAQQDKHFSMFAESPVYMNPAAAGFSPGNMQLFTNFRMQWLTVSDTPFRTISGSADWRMMDHGSFMGMGINFYNDLSGDTKYQTNEVTLPINYAIELSRDNHLSLGIQPAWYQRTMLNQNVTWDNQWTGTSFNTSINSGETILNQNLSLNKFDISAGIYWYAHLNKNVRLSFGLAGHHLSKQKINFMAEDNKLYRKLTLHGQAVFKNPNSQLSIIPAFYGFIQGPNKELVIGSNFRYLIRGSSRVTGYFEEIALSWGAYYRLGDAILANIIFDFAGLSVGAAYDLNISSLTRASGGVGGFEVFLRYRIQFGTGGLGNPSIH